MLGVQETSSKQSRASKKLKTQDKNKLLNMKILSLKTKKKKNKSN